MRRPRQNSMTFFRLSEVERAVPPRLPGMERSPSLLSKFWCAAALVLGLGIGAPGVSLYAADERNTVATRVLFGGEQGFPATALRADGVVTALEHGRLMVRAAAPALHRDLTFRLREPGEDLSRSRYVEAEFTNLGSRPVLFTFWVMSGAGWGGVSTFPVGDPAGRETLAPGASRVVRVDLHARYSGRDVYTPAVDPSAVRWLELVFERGREPLALAVGEIRLVGQGPALPGALAARYRVPPVKSGEPEPGRRVFRALPRWENTAVRHVLGLPREWKPGGSYPVIVEYTGNRFYHKFCYSTGRTEDGHLAAGLARGEKYITLNLPFVSDDGQSEQIDGWGDIARGVDYCLEALAEVFTQFGGDPRAVFFTGFSRGDYAASYLALRDDRIAAVWRGFITGGNPGRPWTAADNGWRNVGVGWNERAARFRNRAWFHAPPELGAEVHADVEFLEDRPSTIATREWLNEQGKAAAATGRPR